MFGGKSVQKDQEWPQELMGGDGSVVLLYQPQVESWKQYKLLRARMAVAFRRTGTASPVLGAVVLEGDTAVSSEAGQVRISNFRIVEGRFPALSASESDRLLNALRTRLTIGLDPHANVLQHRLIAQALGRALHEMEIPALR